MILPLVCEASHAQHDYWLGNEREPVYLRKTEVSPWFSQRFQLLFQKLKLFEIRPPFWLVISVAHE